MIAVQNWIVNIMDVLMGVLLKLPGSGALWAIGLGMALFLVVVRRFTTDQKLLERCDHDKRVLKKRIRALKKSAPEEWVKELTAAQEAVLRRHRIELPAHTVPRVERMIRREFRAGEKRRLVAARNRVVGLALKQEGVPLLAAVVLLILIASWCYARLGFHPPEAREPVGVTAYFPVTQIGQTAYLVPRPGLEAEEGWMRRIESFSLQDNVVASGTASWVVRGDARGEAYPLDIRYGGATHRHELLIGQPHYSEPLAPDPDSPQHGIQLEMRPMKLLGVVPGFGPFFPPWLVGYLLISLSAMPLLKRLLKTY